MKPLLKWAGGKARLAPSISLALGKTCEGTYFEPFVGSGAVYLHLKAERKIGKAVLSDANAKLVEVHRAVRDRVDDVLKALDRMPRKDYRDHYYDVREAYNEGPWDGPEHAARFLWLNRAGFNGLYRENRKGKFNVPVGRYARLSIPSPDHFRQVSEMLQDAELRCADFREVLDDVGREDHVYCDPPYVPLSQTACFTGYHSGPFGIAEQKALADSARDAAHRGAIVVLSNHDLPVVRNELYPLDEGFRHVARPSVSRAISRKASNRKPVHEVIAAIGPMAPKRSKRGAA